MTLPYARMIVPAGRATVPADKWARLALLGDLLALCEYLGVVPETGVGGTVPPVPIDATAPVGPTVPDAVSDALSEKRCADG